MFRRSPKLTPVEMDRLDGFFAQLDHLNEAELLRMRATWRSLSVVAHNQAWAAVRAVGARDGISGDIDRIRGRAIAWSSRGTNTRPTQVSDDMAWLDVKHEAAEAIVDVALGIALGDRLEDRTRATLMASWGRPGDPGR